MAGHIVALRALRLGDFLVAVPALRALRRAWPEHEVMLAAPGWLGALVSLAECADTLLPVPGLVPLPQRAAWPDIAVNLHGAGPQSTAVLDALRPAQRIGHAGHGWTGPAWVADLHGRDRWCRLLRWAGVPADPGDFRLEPPGVPSQAPGAVVIHPGAAYESKRWPVNRFARVAGELRAAGYPVVVTGSAAERDLAARLAGRAGLPAGAVLAGRTGLLDLAALVAEARLVISGDTGIAHLAYAFGTPSVTLFGPVPARLCGPPPGGPHRTLSRDAARRGDRFGNRVDPALIGVRVSHVLTAAYELLVYAPVTSANVRDFS
ncbi:MAG TPA: glycosyltransferase family 9 protein [Actinophytocola sp.]|uniref:glycosyltransferase family 9 protein n=1 Tax=Actinophytocola sp. TaxID=1872138 RepID=UPI002DB88EDB|nr:glycosyltransferase family 9 protein [Actinophytocola sp.]HEU5474987.1 glycosyltransferase family 9 protein [Actinophytocola sp.]